MLLCVCCGEVFLIIIIINLYQARTDGDKMRYKLRCVFTDEGVTRQNSTISRRIEDIRRHVEQEEDVMRRTGTLPSTPPAAIAPPLPLAMCLLVVAFVLGRLCIHMSYQVTGCVQ